MQNERPVEDMEVDNSLVTYMISLLTPLNLKRQMCIPVSA